MVPGRGSANAKPGNLETKNPRQTTGGGEKFPAQLTFAVLETFARPRLAVFFSLSHAWVTREKTFRLKNRAQVSIYGEQGAGKAMANGTCLAVRAAAGDR